MITRGKCMRSLHLGTFVMASRSIVRLQETKMLEVNSYIRKYHVYKAVAMCYIWRGNTIINEDRFVVVVLN